MTSNVKAFLVIWEHEHGKDMWLCASEAKAKKVIAHILTEYAPNEIRDTQKLNMIFNLIKADEIMKAADLFIEAMTEGTNRQDSLTIKEMPILEDKD